MRWICALVLFLNVVCCVAGDLHPYDLRCEFEERPLGIDETNPRLSWKLQSPKRGERQTAFQILAASSPQELGADEGDLWDSGKVDSTESFHVSYAGKPLASLQQVFWKVRVWDAAGRVSAWSSPGNFTMGMLRPSDWKAVWVQSPETNHQTLLLRREFKVRPGLKRAVAVVCGLGQYELSFNGRKSGDAVLAPGWTKYDKTCLYDTHDVTRLLREGPNVIGIELGNGMYRVLGGRYTKFKGSFGPLKAIAQLRIEYLDGTSETIITDEQWRVREGAITFSCVYGGEDFDARLEPLGWNQSGFDDSSWLPAQRAEGPGGELRGAMVSAPPIKAFESFTPISANVISNHITVYDLGQNASIMPRITIRGPAGAVVRIIPAELVRTNGAVDRGSVSQNRPGWWQYTLRGDRQETWFPKFFYHGARYLQVERMPGKEGGELPVVDSIEGVVVHSDSDPIGEFECSNELFNRIRRLVRWAQRSNMASVLTDCPHRERLGWLEQYHLNGPSIRYEFDLNRMFAKGMNDMEDCQTANGCVPNIAPEYTIFGNGPDDFSNPFRNSPEWGSAFILVPWQQYQFTGDADLLRRYYEPMKRYAAYLASVATKDILSFGLGDWYDLGPKLPGFSQLTPKELTATAFYFLVHQTLADAALVIGKPKEAQRFQADADRIRASFNRAFFNAETRSYSTDSQCANALPLVMNLVDSSHRDAVFESLISDIRKRTNAVTAGDVGYRYVLRALADAGRSDVIFDMIQQTNRPGYGYQLRKGATSLTESWDARRGSSQNHFMLGQIVEWFYCDLAGIAPDPKAPGFRNVLIRPQPVGDLTWVRARYNSIAGPIRSEWNRSGKQFRLKVSIPPNCTGSIFMPGTDARVIEPKRLGTKGISKRDAWIQVPSGEYVLESRLP